MKKKPELYEEYPIWMVLIFNLAVLLVYLAGAYILFKLSWITGIIYLVYLFMLEIRLYKEGCRYCYYYGKRCIKGRGLIAPIFFKKGNPKKFCEKKFTWKEFIPDLLVVVIPIMVGIALLVSRGFDWLILIALLYPVFTWFVVNPILYGKLACPHCKQGSICCPALKFFDKK